MRVRLPNEFTPRHYQLPLFRYLDGGGKRAFVVWPRRHGKDLTAGHYTAKCAWQKRGLYWHFFPTLEHGRRSLWEAFTPEGRRTLDWIFPGFNEPKSEGSVVARKNEQQMYLELRNGSIWRIMGTDKISSVGAGPLGVVFSEFALGKPKAWDLIRPMLRENGGWALFITTPRGNNHAKKLFDANAGKRSGWYTDHKTIYETGQMFFSDLSGGQVGPDEMMAEERASGMPDALVRQEYLCDWAAANVGSVYGDLLERMETKGGVAAFEHPEDGVYTSWDLGISDATAIWFWRLGSAGVEVVDHYEETGKPISHFFDLIDSKGYAYIKHYLPHDARARSLQTGISVVEQFATRYGVEKVSITPELSLADGLQAGRWLLQNGIKFHVRCAEGVEALKQYHYLWDEDRKVLSPKPEHDWSSHTSDAFRYLACAVRHSDLMARIDKKKAPQLPRPVNSFSLDELWAVRDAEMRES